jgi:protein arginine phosphatase
MEKKKLLFVCTGNTCRSPLAKVMAAAELVARGINDWETDSAGLAALSAMPASENAVAAAAEEGRDLSGHRSKPLTPELLAQSELVLVMTERHRATLQKVAPVLAGKIYTLKGYLGLSGDVPDPYGGDIEEYRRTKEELRCLVERLAAKIKE